MPIFDPWGNTIPIPLTSSGQNTLSPSTQQIVGNIIWTPIVGPTSMPVQGALAQFGPSLPAFADIGSELGKSFIGGINWIGKNSTLVLVGVVGLMLVNGVVQGLGGRGKSRKR